MKNLVLIGHYVSKLYLVTDALIQTKYNEPFQVLSEVKEHGKRYVLLY